MNQTNNPINVTLIDYTGSGSSDPWYAARLLIYTKNTRLEQGEETRAKVRCMDVEDLLVELDYISKTIRSSWEFVDYTFEIRNVTRAFTHQLVRTRTASYAQQAQRVVDMSDFEATTPKSVQECISARCHWDNGMAAIRQAYQQMKNWGIPNQDLRGILPTNVHTNIIAKINLRTLADLVGKRDNLRAQGEYIEVIRDHIVPLVLAIHPWTKSFLYPERTATPNIEALLTDLLGNAGPLDKPKINAALKELDALKAVWG